MSKTAAEINVMVQGIRELGLPCNDQEIRNALKKFNYNQESATNYLLECSMAGTAA